MFLKVGQAGDSDGPVLEREILCSRDLNERRRSFLDQTLNESTSALLSPRELEVSSCFVGGCEQDPMSVEAIAEHLGISPGNVSIRLASSVEKIEDQLGFSRPDLHPATGMETANLQRDRLIELAGFIDSGALTPRQREVVELYISPNGESPRAASEIAIDLGIDQVKVRGHIRDALERLELEESRVEEMFQGALRFEALPAREVEEILGRDPEYSARQLGELEGARYELEAETLLAGMRRCYPASTQQGKALEAILEDRDLPVQKIARAAGIPGCDIDHQLGRLRKHAERLAIEPYPKIAA